MSVDPNPAGETGKPGGLPPGEGNSSAPGLPWKPIVVCGVIVLALAVVYFSPLKAYLQQVQEIKGQLQSLGLAGRLGYTVAVGVLVAMGVPRLIFCPIGGMAFGFVEGLGWTQTATLMGYYAIFLFVRWGGRGWVLRHWPRLGGVHEAFGAHPVVAIFLIRQLPISGLIINLFLGLSHVRHRHFLLGTVLGLLPEAILLTLVGSGAGKINPLHSVVCIVGAVFALGCLCVSSWFAGRSVLYARFRNEFKGVDKKDGDDQ